MKIRYGVSIAGGMTGIPDLPAISIVELSGSRLTEPGFSASGIPAGKEIFISNRDDQRLYRTLPEAGLGVRLDFYRLYARRAAVAAAVKAGAFSLAVDPGELPMLRRIFGVICGIAGKYRLPLTLEVRIPGPAAVAEDFYRFKRSLLYPVRMMCALYPHEPGALEAAEKFAAECRFDCDLFRVCFDAAAGNYLSGNLLERLRRLVRPAGYAAPVMIFDPGVGADPGAYLELDRLAGAQA